MHLFKAYLSFPIAAICLPFVLLAQPTISSFTPITGKPGDVITLTGTNFNTTAANNIVFFGATMATVTAATATSVTLIVPVGATYAPITLLNTGNGLAASSLRNFMPTYSPAKTTITAADFLPKQDFNNWLGRESSRSVVIGDLNGDGKPDLVVPNYNENYIPVYKNISRVGSIGASSFARWDGIITRYQSAPRSVAIGDLDGDGKPDLAVANYGSNTVLVARNNSGNSSIGTSIFENTQDFETGFYPSSVAIEDLDGDGKPDLAVANYGSNSVSVFRNVTTVGNIGAGSFAPKQDFATGIYPISIAISDFDGDGKPDLAAANYYSNTISVFRNTSSSGSLGGGSFAAKQDFATDEYPISLAIGDLDGDSKPDLAVASTKSNSVSVLRNTSGTGSLGAFSFAAKVDFTTGTRPSSVAIGDLDGDGKPDLAVANYLSSSISVFRNTSCTGSIGTGSFATKQDFATGEFPLSVAIGDLDGDGKPDLAAANYSSSTYSILRNANIVYRFTGSGNWDNAANWAGSIVPTSTVPNFINILINPTGSGECILNVPVTVPKSSSITVAPGKRFVIQGNLTISNQ